MVFHGDRGYIEVTAPFNAGKHDHSRVSLYSVDHNAVSQWTFGDVNQYRLQAEHFVRAVRGEDVALFSLEDSRANQAVIDAIYRAGETGAFVAVQAQPAS